MKVYTSSAYAQELLPEGYDISAWESVSVAPNNLITAVVPTAEIVNTEQPIDEENFHVLSELMETELQNGKGFYGQLNAISTGILIDRNNSHEISDGFHRHKRMAETVGRILVNVDPSLTWEQHMHRKIGAAVPHTPLQYARVVRWSQEYWSATPWGSKISVIDAFVIAVSMIDRHAEFELSKQDAADIKHWVLSNAASWQLKPKDVLAYLRRSEGLPNVLLEKIRQGKNGILTLEKAIVIAQQFPDEDGIQLAVADAVIREKYTLEQLKLVVNEVASAADEQSAIEKLAHAKMYMPKQVTKHKGSGGKSTKKSGNSVGLPRLRTPQELFDEFGARIDDVLKNTTWSPERIEVAMSLAGLLQQVVDQTIKAQEIDPKSALDLEQILPVFRTEEERQNNYAILLDGYLQGLVEYIPAVTEYWHKREVRLAIRRLHSSISRTPSELQIARMKVLNDKVIDFK